MIPKGMALKLLLLSSSTAEENTNDVYKQFKTNIKENIKSASFHLWQTQELKRLMKQRVLLKF